MELMEKQIKGLHRPPPPLNLLTEQVKEEEEAVDHQSQS